MTVRSSRIWGRKHTDCYVVSTGRWLGAGQRGFVMEYDETDALWIDVNGVFEWLLLTEFLQIFPTILFWETMRNS